MSDLQRANEAQIIIDELLRYQSVEQYVELMNDLLKGWLCFDPSADDSKERSDKIFGTDAIKDMLKKVAEYEKQYRGTNNNG